MLLVTILVSLLIVMIAFFAVVKSNVLAQKRELEKAKEEDDGRFGGIIATLIKQANLS